METRVVLKLLEPLLGKGYCVTIDNFYTSPELVDALIKNCTDVYGTMRANRKEMPPEFRAPNLKKGDAHASQRELGRIGKLQLLDMVAEAEERRAAFHIQTPNVGNVDTSTVDTSFREIHMVPRGFRDPEVAILAQCTT
ncbi:hypothetical protein HPB47_020973 [Ixodes persulcatus]|uniref:Uncharacterized protein n=1 Tax=Ixodes persulcatus TaxID=34615 RepID=A0AC60QDU0_IXOPE|nr:hypothetical protein HPB47_020973 [Ixodes persulcatus]